MYTHTSGRYRSVHTGGIRYNLFEIYYFEKLHAPRARARRARTRHAREGRQDESTVNNSDSELKFQLTGRLGDLLLSLVSIDGSWDQ